MGTSHQAKIIGNLKSNDIRNHLNIQPDIVTMTANAIQGDREECLQVRMNDYINKPVNLEALMAILKKWSMNIRVKV